MRKCRIDAIPGSGRFVSEGAAFKMMTICLTDLPSGR